MYRAYEITIGTPHGNRDVAIAHAGAKLHDMLSWDESTIFNVETFGKTCMGVALYVNFEYHSNWHLQYIEAALEGKDFVESFEEVAYEL